MDRENLPAGPDHEYSQLEERPREVSLGRRLSGRSSIIGGSLWMVLISLGLFFLPAINGFVAGMVGGYKVRSISRALIAAVLPAVVLAIGLWIILAALEFPLIGAVAGVAVGLLIALSDLGLFLGAIIGGAIGRQPELPAAQVHRG